MIYTGIFNDILGRKISVSISSGIGSGFVEIGGESGKLFFAKDSPIEITHAYNDQFDVIMRESCTIRLLSSYALTQLYSQDVLDNRVTVVREGEVLFTGFVEPQAYSQPYNSRFDDVELTCIDCFSALQYRVWGDVSKDSVDYDATKAAASQMTFGAVLAKCCDAVLLDVEIVKTGIPTIAGSTTSVLDGVLIDTTVFFGDDEESAWTLLEVAESILQYLNLRMCLHQGKVRIYHPDTLGTGNTVEIDLSKSWDRKHQMEVGETFNKLSLTVERDTIENVIPDILDDEVLETVYPGRQLWCSEYHAPRMGSLFYATGLTSHSAGWPCEAAVKKDHYIRVLNAPGWKFGSINPTNDSQHIDDYLGYYNPEEYSQEAAPNNLQPSPGAMLLEVATGEQKYGLEDNAISEKLDTSKYLVIGVNGQTSEIPGSDHTDPGDPESVVDGISAKLKPACPVAEYSGPSLVLSPTDDKTTRYVVFSGKMRLNPVHVPPKKYTKFVADVKSANDFIIEDFKEQVPSQCKTDAQRAGYEWALGRLQALKVADFEMWEEITRGDGAPSNCDMSVTKRWLEKNAEKLFLTFRFTLLPGEAYDSDQEDEAHDGKRYYVRCYWHCATPTSTPTPIDYAVTEGLFPVEDDEKFASLEYAYSQGGGHSGQSVDTIRQLPLLQCMLIVGDKCLVQKMDPDLWNDPMDCYEWRTYMTREQCANDDVYFQQSFTLGIDIKIGDKIIGPEYDIANNISYKLGIDAKGIGIPVRKSDNVSGPVTFRILGPYNALWKNIVRYAPNFYRHTAWATGWIAILNRVSAIWMKDFSVQIKTDKGDDSEDGDLIYTSDTDESFINKKDDLSFKFATALSNDERKLLGVPDVVCRNTPVVSATNKPLTSISDTLRGVSGKPEQLYIDWHWNKAHRARVSLIHGVKDVDGNVDRFALYKHPAMPGKEFLVDGISRDLANGSAQIRMTEK